MRAHTALIIAGTAALGGGVAGSAGALPAFTVAAKAKTASTSTQGTLKAITVGRKATFDRLVFRFSGATPGYSVKFVPQVQPIAGDGHISVLGQRFLQISLTPTVNGSSANAASVITPLFPTLRQVKGAGDFEGEIAYGAGLSKHAGFRVFTLSSPRRVVIDVAH